MLLRWTPLVCLLALGCGEPSHKGQSLAHWLTQLESQHAEQRTEAAIALAHIGKPAVPPLQKLLRQQRPEVRQAAALALGKMDRDAQDALADLIALIDDPEPAVQAAAGRAVGRAYGDDPEAAVAPLSKLLKSADKDCKLEAALALAKVGEKAKAAVPLLLPLLKDGDAKVREETAKALGFIGSEQAAPALIDVLQHETNERVRQHAGVALRRIDRDLGARYGFP